MVSLLDWLFPRDVTSRSTSSSQFLLDSNGEEHSGGQLPRGFGFPLYRNPSRNSEHNANLLHGAGGTLMLPQSSQRPLLATATLPSNCGKKDPGVHATGIRSERESTVHMGQGLLDTNIPALDSWPDERSDTTWWSLYDDNILSGGSATQPLGKYRRTAIEAWIVDAIRIRQELLGTPPLGDSSLEVVYLGEVGPNSRIWSRSRQQRRQGT